MPAYSIPLETKCFWGKNLRCDKRATHEVFNTWNESCGKYCTRHAAALVKEINQGLKQRITTTSTAPQEEW